MLYSNPRGRALLYGDEATKIYLTLHVGVDIWRGYTTGISKHGAGGFPRNPLMGMS